MRQSVGSVGPDAGVASSWRRGFMGEEPIGSSPMPGDRRRAVARPWEFQVGDRIPAPRRGVIRPPVMRYQRKSVMRTDVSSRQERIIPSSLFLRPDNSVLPEHGPGASSRSPPHTVCMRDDVRAVCAALPVNRTLRRRLPADQRFWRE